MKNKIKIISALLLAGIAAYLVLFFKADNFTNADKAAGSINNIFLQRQILAEQLANKILSEVANQGRNAEQLFATATAKDDPPDFSIRVFEKEKLLFWNDQRVVPAYKASLETGLIKDAATGNIFYLTIVKQENLLVWVSDLIYEDHSFTNRYIRTGFTNAYNAFKGKFLLSLNDDSDHLILDHSGRKVFGLLSAEEFQNEEATTFMFWNILMIALNLSLLYIFIFSLLKAKYANQSLRVFSLFSIFVAFVFVLLILLEPFLNQHEGFLNDANFADYFNEIHFFNGGIGLYFLHAVVSLCIALMYAAPADWFQHLNKTRTSISSFVGLGFIAGILILYQYLLVSISEYTNGIIEISRLASFDWNELLALFYLIAVSIAAIYLLSLVVFFLSRMNLPRPIIWILLTLFTIPALALFYFGQPEFCSLAAFIYGVIILALLVQLSMSSAIAKRRIFLIGLAFLMSGQLTYVIVKENERKTIQNLKLTAHQLSFEKDPLFEFLWRSAYSQINKDNYLLELLKAMPGIEDNELEMKLMRYFEKKYFPDYFKKFDVWLSLCRPESQLYFPQLNETVGCNDYFKALVEQQGQTTEAPGLYLLEDVKQGLYYLANIPVQLSNQNNRNDSLYIIIEFYQKLAPKGLGYIELLADQFSGLPKDVSEYSIAVYQSNELIYKTGNRLFPVNYKLFNPENKMEFNSKFHQNIVQKINDQRLLVVSKRKPAWSMLTAPFSFFFLFLILPIIGQFAAAQPFSLTHGFTFRFRLQTLLLGSLLLSILTLGAGSIYYITEVYEKKNSDFLFEKTQSILTEIEKTLPGQDLNSPENLALLQEHLARLSRVFFSDINVYNTEGHLITSSRHDIFEKSLQSVQMNPSAYYNLKFGQNLYFRQSENISGFDYVSSYVPLTLQSGDVAAFVNLPYFARETDLQNELASLVLTYVNLFIIISVLAVILVLLFSRPLLEPLQMIQDKMRSIRIGHTNEKIVWKRRDELGQLVMEYNHLIEKLAISAEKLAANERESAWREMARQIAHEIKNPLTPMRLSVQYMLRAWNDKDEKIDEKIKITSQTIISQIDTLSSIATAFSDFARMPENNKAEKVELIALLRELIVLFDNQKDLVFALESNNLSQIYLQADQPGLHRVFTNLIKNSVQAIGSKPDGKIRITVEALNEICKIVIADNGKGMSAEEAKRVFSPNFTTKTSGMGIGLAMVHNLVKTYGGEIEFETEPNTGTTFILHLPLARNNGT